MLKAGPIEVDWESERQPDKFRWSIQNVALSCKDQYQRFYASRARTCYFWRSGLTRKEVLTYVRCMVVASKRRSDVFTAISHPARRRMLDQLAEADRSVNSITVHFKMSRPAVSQHLRVLLDAGLVREQWHGREHRYRLVPEQLSPVRNWIGRYEQFWDDRLLRLQKQLSRTNKK